MNISKYYYHRLNNELKRVYIQICKGISCLNNSIVLPLINKNKLSLIYESVLLDNPIFFYTISYQCVIDFNNQRILLTPIYRYTDEVIKQSAETLNGYLHRFDVVKHKSDVEKELYVHDFCLENFSYDYTFNKYSFSPLGLLVYKTGVCEGISKFVKIVMDYLKVECMLVSGTARSAENKPPELHMWNIVSINGNAYHLDVTFDMSQTNRVKRYDYFNLPDVEIKRDHFITTKAPKCNAVGRDYYSANSLVFFDLKEMGKHIKKELLAGKRFIVVKFGNRQFSSSTNIVEQVAGASIPQYQRLFNRSVSAEIAYNPSQCVFEVAFN